MHYDVVIVGSGFGGSVAALRLTEKGYRVAVIEAGKRFVERAEDVRDNDTTAYADTSWDLRRFLWAPAVGCFGIQRIHTLDNVLILAGAGVGGGSLVYANTLYRPLDGFYDDPAWSHLADWRAELAPYYDLASRMLGSVTYPRETPADAALRRVAERMGAGETFHAADVGVFLGLPGMRPGEEADDPYFGGSGPRRTACLDCGECMTGCRWNAKNTLDKNYLYLAERGGAVVYPMTTVREIRPMEGGYAVDAVRTGRQTRRRATLTADQVVVAAGTYGTQRLLHRMKYDGLLPELSDRLGHLTRTNSESIGGARSRRPGVDFTEGVAITSSFHPNPHTRIEPVRYGKDSNSMGLLQSVLVDGGQGSRARSWLRAVRRDPAAAARTLRVAGWSESTIVTLVMQSLDNSLIVSGSRDRLGRFRLRSKQGHGQPNPGWIPEANQAARLLAEEIGGDAGSNWGDVIGRPLTAHFLGGVGIGDSPGSGVIDPYHRVFGHPGLHVVDGSAVTANLGVNPSLTITAQAERAFAMWPNKGADDPRPSLGSAYRPVPPVAPTSPAVTTGAYAVAVIPRGTDVRAG